MELRGEVFTVNAELKEPTSDWEIKGEEEREQADFPNLQNIKGQN